MTLITAHERTALSRVARFDCGDRARPHLSEADPPGRLRLG